MESAIIVGMARRWCVCGLVPHDSGKTWLTIALVKALRKRGVKARVAKPVAGHSAWLQRNTLRYSERLGLLVGEDVYSYIEALGLRREDVPLANPVDLLLAPPSAVKAIRSGNLSSYAAKLESSVGQLVLARVPGSGLEPRHFVIEDNVSLLQSSLRDRVLELARKLGADRVELSEFLSILKSRAIEDRVCRCVDAISRDAEVLVIESFNDALVPVLRLVTSIELFVLTAVGAVAVYRNSESVIRAIELEIAMRGEEALRTQFVLSRVRPEVVEEIEFANSVDELASSSSLHRLLERILPPSVASREPL